MQADPQLKLLQQTINKSLGDAHNFRLIGSSAICTVCGTKDVQLYGFDTYDCEFINMCSKCIIVQRPRTKRTRAIEIINEANQKRTGKKSKSVDNTGIKSNKPADDSESSSPKIHITKWIEEKSRSTSNNHPVDDSTVDDSPLFTDDMVDGILELDTPKIINGYMDVTHKLRPGETKRKARQLIIKVDLRDTREY